MSKIKKVSKRKLALLLVVLTLIVSGTAYAASKYEITTFSGNKDNVKSVSGILTEVEKLTTNLNHTSASLSSEKNDHRKDVNSANDYAKSVSSALQSTTEDTSNANAAISTASSAVSYDPSTSSSSGK